MSQDANTELIDGVGEPVPLAQEALLMPTRSAEVVVASAS
jgi:hypothetical protein